MAAAWLGLAMPLVPLLLEGAYRGAGFGPLNRLAGRADLLGEWLGRWHVLSWSAFGAMLCAGAFAAIVTCGRPRWLLRWGAPLAAFLLVRCLLWVSFAAAPVAKNAEELQHRQDGTVSAPATSFDVNAWSRWDSHVYRTIAQRGYEFYPCDIPWDGVPISRAGEWCGDTAWFPGYPALMWVTARLGVPEAIGGLLWSALFGVLTLWLLWTRFLPMGGGAKNALCLLLAAAFPGAIYYHALYPISIAAFFVLLAVHMAIQRRWVLCGLAGAAATFAYPQSAFLGPILALWILCNFRDAAWWKRLGWIAIIGSIMSAAVVLVFAVQKYFVGSWVAFFVMQSGYKDGGLHSPLSTLASSAQELLQSRSHMALGAEVLFVSAMMAAIVYYFSRQKRHSPAEWCLAGFLLMFWLAPLVLGHYSLARRFSLLVCAMPLAQALPERWLRVAVAGSLVVTMLLGTAYFTGSMP